MPAGILSHGMGQGRELANGRILGWENIPFS